MVACTLRSSCLFRNNSPRVSKGAFYLWEAMTSEDERFMQMALTLAELGRGQTSPNPMVGAVLVKDGEVIGQGAHLKAGLPHAEVHALRMAGDKANGATAYVTLEPCSHHGRTPPCADALIDAGVRRVVIAIQDPDVRVQGQGVLKLRQAGIEVVTGILATAVEILNEEYLTFKQKGRPFVTWKCAATLDGYIATSSGHSSFVTGPESRRTVHDMRRRVSAVAVGIQTVLADNPRLTVRLSEDPEANLPHPVRVVFDSRLRMPPDAAMLKEPGQTLIYTTNSTLRHSAQAITTLRERGAEVVGVEEDAEGHVQLAEALNDLAQRGYQGVLVEGGATITGALLKEQLVDKVVYYMAPKLLGGGLPALTGYGPTRMDEAIPLHSVVWTQVGDDLRLEGYPVYPARIGDRKGD